MPNECNCHQRRVHFERTDAARGLSRRKARQGEIILKTKWSRAIFFAGLFGGIVLMAAVAIYLGIFG
ncbi:MAG: hypothetical protein ACSLE4_09145 [Methyloceanibacter sp.]|uniref:hypothetical protein n=1 Tax=Methyloceanibacter sp. TaxID=1965321 RepID=UPI003EDF12B0